jgi:XTP/dITP diphosphohydrolase
LSRLIFFIIFSAMPVLAEGWHRFQFCRCCFFSEMIYFSIFRVYQVLRRVKHFLACNYESAATRINPVDKASFGLRNRKVGPGKIMHDLITMVIATRNAGKTAEIRDLLKGYAIIIKNLDDFGPIPEVAEDGDTFEENAYQKASFAAKVLGMPALADDSGLVVDALGGAPGLHSARYAGEGASDLQRCHKLLAEMKGKKDRKAVFECVISVAVPGGPALTYEARCEGLITEKSAGQNGFGYDPIFYYPPLKKTFAQLTRAEKSRVSHRGKALRELRDEFDKVLVWIHRHMPV